MVSVILPTYNERENIRGLIESILSNLALPVEIIVVDDDSPDKTWEVVEKISQLNDNIKLLRRLKERGLASAVKEGISLAKGDKIVSLDADFSMPPGLLKQMVSYLDNVDMVVGSRYVMGGNDSRDSLMRVYSSRFFNLLARWILNSKIRDLTSGFLAFRKTAIQSSSIRGRYGEYCIELLYKAQRDGLSILEFPYNCINRERGQSKTSPDIFSFLRYGILYMISVLKLRCRNL